MFTLPDKKIGFDYSANLFCLIRFLFMPVFGLSNFLTFKLIQARLRNMNRTNNSSSLASPYTDFISPNEPIQMPIEFDNQPEMRAMLIQQTATIIFTLLGNMLMIFVILRNNFVIKRKRITPVSVIGS